MQGARDLERNATTELQETNHRIQREARKRRVRGTAARTKAETEWKTAAEALATARERAHADLVAQEQAAAKAHLEGLRADLGRVQEDARVAQTRRSEPWGKWPKPTRRSANSTAQASSRSTVLIDVKTPMIPPGQAGRSRRRPG